MHSARRSGRWSAVSALLALILLGLAALLMGAAGPAYRLEWFTLSGAFGMLRYGAYAAFAAAGLGLITLVMAAFCRRGRPALVGGLALIGTMALLIVPLMHLQQARVVPPIHDITTDTDDPPAFVALVEVREAAPNAVEYPGESFARQQREAYPDIEALELPISPDDAFEAAVAEVHASGWELIAANNGRIEAVATTTWFGFKDDVAIRLRESEGGTRVDMRSASRLGRSDAGANAARIRTFFEALERHQE
ncbi:DUF1499 domain-containing protein [Billgrantia montanilacus]|uniref:DUF1499 domain-containing protein n=1 Tax=Billgrantia montanilacus TaxID=2282305 RepID=A0A368TNB5_9GAMM|nr:DUF1499 domain-containing protein [Halomonas montanilacus]RCV86209.1 DUF1499 domain-containing protein [Halomonas montanilacus]